MLNEIQKHDYDRYLTLIFCDKDKRDDILSAVLFNLEIARVKSRVSEQMIGLIRFQWWREAIEEIFDSARAPRRHDVVLKLKELVTKYQLQKTDFLQIIDARESDLDEVPFKTIDDFNRYALNTSYPLNKIILDILGVDDESVIAAVKAVSQAWAMCAILRSANKNFAHNRTVFPQDLMRKHNVDAAKFGKPEFVESSKPLVNELYNIAEAQLNSARLFLKNTPREQVKRAGPVLLNLTTTQNHLNQIRNNNYDIFTRNLNPYLGIAGLIKIYFGKY
jgi:NADH dehydrogenase [ubiquinone] 1 alpha subcomplex assembly factor 6